MATDQDEAQPSIAELLEQSRTAHAEYRLKLPRMVKSGGALVQTDGDPVAAAEALDRAATLRKQAHDRDPDMTDDAWTIDHALTGGPHTLLTFYAEHLARTDHLVAVAARNIAEAKREAGGPGRGVKG